MSQYQGDPIAEGAKGQEFISDAVQSQTHDLLLLSREHDGSEDGYEDEDRGDLEGEEQLGEKDRAELRDVADGVAQMAAEIDGAEGLCVP